MIDHRGNGGGLRYIGRNGHRAAAHGLDFRNDGVGIAGPFAIIDRDRSTGIGERQRNRRADAADAPVTSAI